MCVYKYKYGILYSIKIGIEYIYKLKILKYRSKKWKRSRNYKNEFVFLPVSLSPWCKLGARLCLLETLLGRNFTLV